MILLLKNYMKTIISFLILTYFIWLYLTYFNILTLLYFYYQNRCLLIFIMIACILSIVQTQIGYVLVLWI